ncbi:CCAAT-binding protein subunit HAP3 [Hyaloscypha finlandica]|nr:CCAAT-binding protein subunit HAP3 [Hyaloscypha finlandica]KAH8768469.1 CCAAT-binding protein subunit HAP3 [Hyaloscypha sp. PMI_1271]
MSSPAKSPPDVEQGGVNSGEDPDAQMNQDPHASGLGYEFEVKEQDRWLPIANGYGVTAVTSSIMSHDSSSHSPETPRVSKSGKQDTSDANIRNFAPVARIMKTALPENAKIAKEAKECMQECVSEFISFITSEASEKCHQEKRKTVNGEDILFAMTSLGFENYAEALKIYLSKYRETQSTRGENRPGSQGFGSAAAGASGAAIQGGAEGANNILGQPGEGAEHDAGSYGNLYGQAGHNGATGGEGY